MDASIERLARDGYCVVHDVLDPASVRTVRSALLDAAALSEARGMPTHFPQLDPSDRNVRVFNLIDLHAVFRELILHPTAVSLVRGLIGDSFMISNFTANIALPGSESMNVHADQAIVIPEPWLAPQAINIIWCLDDVTEANGGTRFLPDSHQVKTVAELPESPRAGMRAFEAPAGSIVAMDGRMWHTSGANTTDNEERALLFGYYTLDFIRPQVNWNAQLSEEVIAGLSPELFARLGLGPIANQRLGGELVVRN